MCKITLISTVHKETGKCNSDELHKIIETINPEVIFLEAREEDYTEYDRTNFSQFGVFKKSLELRTIQTYSQNHTFEYVPVLDVELSDEFDTLIRIVSEDEGYKSLFDNYNQLEMEGGFEFLNSKESILLQEEMRELGNRIISDEIFNQKVNASTDEYENSMIRNIYTFSKEKSFSTAIFMCGAAHRKSIVERIAEYEITSKITLNWTFYNDI
ncbi:MAG: hypothetical protein ABIV51_03990 [Saprospiraceae bacterium]